MRKVKIKLQIDLSILVDEGIEISEVIDELDYQFIDTTGSATVEDFTIEDYEISDSK